jgi:hypothetical protein
MGKVRTNLMNSNKSEDLDNNKSIPFKCLKVFHQNICGLQNKISELFISLCQDLPHIVCISEHHLEQSQLLHIHMENYT